MATEAYWRIFEFIRTRKRNYQLTFGSEAGQRVLQDLGTFCRADESCFNADPRLHAVAEGRREVWLRIQKHLNLTSEQLVRVFNGGSVNTEESNDVAS